MSTWACSKYKDTQVRLGGFVLNPFSSSLIAQMEALWDRLMRWREVIILSIPFVSGLCARLIWAFSSFGLLLVLPKSASWHKKRCQSNEVGDAGRFYTNVPPSPCRPAKGKHQALPQKRWRLNLTAKRKVGVFLLAVNGFYIHVFYCFTSVGVNLLTCYRYCMFLHLVNVCTVKRSNFIHFSCKRC